jgi:hypothetical protein
VLFGVLFGMLSGILVRDILCSIIWGYRSRGGKNMKEQVKYLLTRYTSSRNVRLSLIVISVLLMALAGGAPDMGMGI